MKSAMVRMVPQTPIASTECAPQPRMDPLAKVGSTVPPHVPLRAVTIEGLGRVAMHSALLNGRDSLGIPGPCPGQARRAEHSAHVSHSSPALPTIAWPDAPGSPWCRDAHTAATHAFARRRTIAQWLASADDADDADETYCAPGAYAPRDAACRFYHPMVAKLLRDKASTRTTQAPDEDQWIGPDGRRAPKAATRRATVRPRRRVASTAASLAASEIAPVMGCRCGFTDKYMGMVQCDQCARWLHLACVGVMHVEQLGADDWYCDDCYEQHATVRTASPGRHALCVPDTMGPTLSLAPSPHRSTLDSISARRAWPSYSEPLTSPLASTASSERAMRTPSPPAYMDMLTTPSRHVHPDARMRSTAAPCAAGMPSVGAPWLPTPPRYLTFTPHVAMPTPLFGALPTPHAVPVPPETPHDVFTAWPSSASGSSAHKRDDPWSHPESPTPVARGKRAGKRDAMAFSTPAHMSPVSLDESVRGVSSSSPYPVTPRGLPTRAEAEHGSPKRRAPPPMSSGVFRAHPVL
ncbi:hypothetical protein MVES1_003429 [Malassezia vespertilionis]|nr:uncharacterized protein MVES1_003429 [Malassezia vespertilionis]WFD08060.1 hypothetical protein MVES1_003429 [Malassezia vespertilionis]